MCKMHFNLSYRFGCRFRSGFWKRIWDAGIFFFWMRMREETYIYICKEMQEMQEIYKNKSFANMTMNL